MEAAGIVAIVHAPPLQPPFGAATLPWWSWSRELAAGAGPFWLDEAAKRLRPGMGAGVERRRPDATNAGPSAGPPAGGH